MSSAFARLAACPALAAGLLIPPIGLAGPAHEHALARLEIAYDAGRLTVALASPLDNLLGFERAPRTAAERQAAAALVATLKGGDKLFVIDPEAGCTAGAVELVSAPLQLGSAQASPAGQADHADLDGNWQFDCKGPPPAWVEHGLFAAFKRLSRIEVQTATPKGQSKLTLKAPARRVALKR